MQLSFILIEWSLTACLDISITAHGGIINAFLEVIGRERYSLPTGGR